MELTKDIIACIRQAPKQLKYIAWYNIINFYSFILLSFLLPVIFILFEKNLDQYSWGQLALLLLPLIFVGLNYYLLVLTRKLLKGSKKAYQIMLIFFLIQIFGFDSENYSLYFELSAIPLKIELTIYGIAFKLNFIALFFSIYLLGIKNKYMAYIEGKLNMAELTKN